MFGIFVIFLKYNLNSNNFLEEDNSGDRKRLRLEEGDEYFIGKGTYGEYSNEHLVGSGRGGGGRFANGDKLVGSGKGGSGGLAKDYYVGSGKPGMGGFANKATNIRPVHQFVSCRPGEGKHFQSELCDKLKEKCHFKKDHHILGSNSDINFKSKGGSGKFSNDYYVSSGRGSSGKSA